MYGKGSLSNITAKAL